MRETSLDQFTAAEASGKLNRRVRSRCDIAAYGVRQGDTGTVIGMLAYLDGSTDVIVSWDPPRATVAAPPRKYQDVFDRLEYQGLLEEINGQYT